MKRTQRIFLVGPRGCGKTTIGLMLATKLGARFWDTDLVLQDLLGRSIADFVASEGWERFREEEHKALCLVLEKADVQCPHVVSTGGGIVLGEANRKLLCRTRKPLPGSLPQYCSRRPEPRGHLLRHTAHPA